MATNHLFDALGDASRRMIMEKLRNGPSPVGALAAGLPISRPAVSQHLRVLETGGLVTHEAVGTRRVYRLDPDGIAELRRWLDDYWSAALDAYAEYVGSTRNAGPTAAPPSETPERSAT